MWQLCVGVSKLNRYASRDSGDTVEVVERPSGGLSIVIADAQGTGPAAKSLSNLVTSKAVGLIKEGVRDSAVHEAVHDHLYHYKGARVSCTLTTITADTRLRLYTVTRNSPTPAYFVYRGELLEIADHSSPLGILDGLRPACSSAPLAPDVVVVAVSDGIYSAGARSGRPLDLGKQLTALAGEQAPPAELAERLLAEAVERDLGRPADDMTVAVVGVLPGEEERRTMSVRLPLRKEMVLYEE